jgi:hypothetical protein
MNDLVYVNHSTGKARVHTINCPEYICGKADETEYGDWNGVFKNFNGVLNFAISAKKRYVTFVTVT